MMNGIRRSSTVALVILVVACVTVPPPPAPTDWSASATASPGFTGAGANVAGRSTTGGTTVNIAFREATGVSGTVRPWHVHYGTCGNDQGIVGAADAYPPLRPGADGTATTSATITESLAPGRSYFVNIHKSPTELSTIVACGALTSSTPASAQTSTY